MIFKPNATVTELWCYPADCKKAKRQGVSGRDFHSLTFRLTGQISVLACGQNLISSPGCITYVPQGQAYVTEVIEETTMLAVNFHAAQTVLSPVPWVHKAQDQKNSCFCFIVCWKPDAADQRRIIAVCRFFMRSLRKLSGKWNSRRAGKSIRGFLLQKSILTKISATI